MIAAPSGLAQAFDRAHSGLFDLASAAPSSRAMVQYRNAPVRFAVEVLGIPEYRLRWSLNRGYCDENGVMLHQWDGDVDPIAVLLEAVADGYDVCVEAGTGTQKSYTLAVLVLWFLACWEGAIVRTFAPVARQLTSYLWKEIRGLWPRFVVHFPEAKLLALEIRMRGGMDNSWGAMGVAADVRAGEDSNISTQGMHAPHMLLLYEEGTGVEASVYAAGENTCTAPHNLRVAVGNPDNQLDPLHTFGYDSAGQPRANMRCLRISALDHPNVVCNDAEIVPGAVAAKSVTARWNKYVTRTVDAKGQSITIEGRLYQSRVRGLSPAEAAEALIRMDWIRAAQARFRDRATREILEMVGQGQRALGIDAANSKDGDAAAVSRWKGAVCSEVPEFPCPNANNLGFRTHLEMDEQLIEPSHVGVDTVGVGAGCYNELLKYGKVCVSIAGGATSDAGEEQWNNMRSQVLWTLREDLRLGMIALPPDDEEMVRQMLICTWKTQNSKICVEPKEKIQERTENGKSPNKFDALAYGNFVRPRDAVTADKPNVAPTIAQRIAKELHELDQQPRKRKFFGTLRQ